jgi:hypothetical protein
MTTTQQDEKPGAPRQDAEAEAATVDEALAQAARQIGAEPSRLKNHPEAARVLEMMGKGVLVALSIHRPRFTVNLTFEDLGIEYEKLGLKASKRMRAYMRLGKRSLLPDALQKRLQRVEMKARASLYRFGLDSPWRRFGYYVNFNVYKEWERENAECEAEFNALRDEILREYPRLVARVLRDYRKVALRNWQHLRAGWVVAKTAPPEDEEEDTEPGDEQVEGDVVVEEDKIPLLTGEQYETGLHALLELQEQQLQAGYVESYLARTRARIPPVEDVARAFLYEVELIFIPLPSLLAHDLSKAEAIYKERALQDAQYQAQLEEIHAQERLARQKQRTEELVELETRRQEIELVHQGAENARRQLEMETAAINRAVARQDLLIEEFYSGVVGQINVELKQACERVLRAMEDHEGRMTPSTGRNLRNLIAYLRNMNFVGDATIEQHITRLQAVLPAAAESGSAAGTKRRVRIDTVRVSRVVHELLREADEVISDLNFSPTQRSVRTAPARAALVDQQPDDEQEEEVGLGVVTRQRSRRSINGWGEEGEPAAAEEGDLQVVTGHRKARSPSSKRKQS